MSRFQLIKLGLIIVIMSSCSSEVKNSIKTNPNNTIKQTNIPFQLKAGDILFQDIDCGQFCESIEKVTFGYGGSKFSHVAMVIPTPNNQLTVLEAVTKGVVETSIDSFLMRSFDQENKSKVVVGRLKPTFQHLIPKAINFAKTKKGAEYDEVFDITNDKYYCSELLYFAFKHANDNNPIFQLQNMTYKDPETGLTFPIWSEYFKNLNVDIPEGKPGLNPGGMSMSEYIDIVHFYGKPNGFEG